MIPVTDIASDLYYAEIAEIYFVLLGIRPCVQSVASSGIAVKGSTNFLYISTYRSSMHLVLLSLMSNVQLIRILVDHNS